MALTDFTEIPVINLAGLLTDDPAAQLAVAEAMGRAARDVGFFYLTGTGMDPALFDGVLEATQRYFEQSREAKMAQYIGNSRNHRGYVPEGEEIFAGKTSDLKEAFDLAADLPADDPDYLAGNPMLGPNQWPPLPGFAVAVEAYYEAVRAVGSFVFRGLALGLGERADYFDDVTRKPPSQLRLIRYPVDETAASRPGIGDHTDYEAFTLLRSTSPGLEVLAGNGKWIDAPPLADAFVVNIGDMLELWTNGEYVATTHRVRAVEQERWSFPLFFSLDYDTLVTPMERFAAPGRPLLEPLVAGEHLFAQTAQSFGYLQKRLAAGEITLPERSVGLSSFGQETRLKVGSPA
jgi:isopenicillin N synthase-like dioxygenase